MSTYFDTGVLAKVYCLETNSDQAIALVNRHPPPLLFTSLQELEIRTALRLKHFRTEIDASTLAGALSNLEADVQNGVFMKPPCDFGRLFRQAEAFSEKGATKFGCRSLDVLHVAAAFVLEATAFVSFDERQKKLAKFAGLKVIS